MSKKKLKTFRVFASVMGSKYLGEFQAATKEEAEDMALKSDAASISLCHQCSHECEDAAVDKVEAEEV